MNESVRLFLSYENRTCFAPDNKRQLPVTLITGFLGAGKTTLLNHLVSNKQDLRIAAAVNDFAALNIDSELIADRDDRNTGVVALSNGCLCCTLSDNLQSTVWKLLQGDYSDFSERHFDQIDYLVIETSGITDPLALIELLERKYGKMTRVRLDSVITVMDTDAIYSELEVQDVDHALMRSEITMNQLRCADVVLLNKKDMVSADQMATVERWVRRVVPQAAVYPCEQSHVPLPHLLDVEYKLFDQGQGSIQRETLSTPYVLQPRADPMLRQADNRALATSRSEEAKALRQARKDTHIANENFNSTVFESEQVVALARLQDLLCLTESEGGLPSSIVRAKGFMCVDVLPQRRLIFHWSGRRRYQVTWDVSKSLSRATRLVFIGNGVDHELIHQRMQAILLPSPSQPVAEAGLLQAQREEAWALLAEQVYFEPLFQEALPGFLLFRLNGSQTTALSMKEIDERFGLDWEQMNEDLIRAVNATPGGQGFLVSASKELVNEWVTSPLAVPSSAIVFALGGQRTLPSMWAMLEAHALRVISTHFAPVQACLCGF